MTKTELFMGDVTYSARTGIKKMHSFVVGEMVGVTRSSIHGLTLIDEVHYRAEIKRGRCTIRNGLNAQTGRRTARVVFTGDYFITVEYVNLGTDSDCGSWCESFSPSEMNCVYHLKGQAA